MAKGASRHAIAGFGQPQRGSSLPCGRRTSARSYPPPSQDQARRLGAWTRTRGIVGIDALLQALLGYVLCARSLRQLGAWATLVGLGSISDRAWSKRIRHSTAWARWLLGALVQPSSCGSPERALPVRIRVIDA
jgi:hypothetical protein